MKTQQPWAFDFPDGDHVQVHYGTGHWAARLNRETGMVGDGIYIFEATWTHPDSTKTETCITQAQFYQLRRHEAKKAKQATS